ncbi:isochorismate synthase [Zooshikella marina]|uniref:isochorismate synthase n=1 Tax=Zooshikella ganghwensis TaxID=202772 RepID=UPI001BAF4894|nr:isochorismate synthase [Zooshikella ganghwensis]MBU2707608.1 isochorismate synthase [Zooshikella ganghwensis]
MIDCQTVKGGLAKLEKLVNTYCIKGTSWPIICRVRLPINSDVTQWPSWLAAQSVVPQLFWQQREHKLTVAALGSADTLKDRGLVSQLNARVEQRLACPVIGDGTPKYWGGAGFDQAQTWQNFPGALFFLPSLSLEAQGGQQHLVFQTYLTHAEQWSIKQQALRKLVSCLCWTMQEQASLPRYVHLHDEPNAKRWQQQVRASLAAFKKGQCDKVVLSRRRRLIFNQQVTPWQLLAMWQASQQHLSYPFCLSLRPGEGFVGCSPEQLFSLENKELTTEALAGSMGKHADPERDKQYSNALFESAKLQQENQWVVKYIQQQLALLVSQQTLGPLSVKTLPYIHHLFQPIKAQLLPSTSVADILTALHPTPAVKGFPADAAEQMISQLETYPRGWYAGVLGFWSRNQAEFCVTIRSAHVHRKANNRCGDKSAQPEQSYHYLVDLFSGAGLVEGSVASQEWQELDQKLSQFMEYMQHAATDNAIAQF